MRHIPCAIDHLLTRVEALGVAYGRENSFKLSQNLLLPHRVLIGVQADAMSVWELLDIAAALGMPRAGRDALLAHTHRANAYFLGLEERSDGCICKVYLEFWDQVAQEVQRTGLGTPLLLHLGLKWHSARPGQMELARYICHPLLSSTRVLGRMAGLYPQDGRTRSLGLAQSIVKQGMVNQPAAALLYAEVSEEGNPRRSFDVNLYQTELLVSQVADALRQIAHIFGIGELAMEPLLLQHGPLRLGHLSGGIDRQGQEFVSIYAEAQQG